MPRLPIRTPILVLALLCAAPAFGQWLAPGRWATGDGFRPVAPGTWMVLRQNDGVEISAEGDHHVGRLTLWCTTTMPGGGLIFDTYNGSGLQHAPADAAELTSEVVTLMVDAQRFDVAFVHIPWERLWVADAVMSPSLMDAFANGSRLDLRNAAGEGITGYHLHGSSAAREAVRRACGF